MDYLYTDLACDLKLTPQEGGSHINSTTLKHPDMQWTPIDLIATFFAIVVGLAVLLVIGSASIRGEPLEEGGRKIVGEVILAMLFIVLTFVNKRKKK